MSKLISGKEALIALANGEDVEYYKHEWMDVNRLSVRYLTSSDSMYKFRLKPRTITINGIEVPAPFKPEIGELYYYLWDCQGGYSSTSYKDSDPVVIGAWRTEEEIKQVVAVVAGVFLNEI